MKKVEQYSGKDVFGKVKGRTGIVSMKDFWGTPQVGDHIDLWNGWRLTHFRSILAVYTPLGDYDKGGLWFWEVA